MDLSQYRGNSNASKNDISVPEREPVTNVVSGRKIAETPGRKFMSEFLSDDIHNIKDYIIYDVIIPALKNAISDTITNGIDMLLFGQTRVRGFNGSNTIKRIGNNTPYSSIYNSTNKVTRLSSNNVEPDRRQVSYRNSYSVQDVLIPFTIEEPHNITKGKANEALTALRMRLNKYGFVSVADFYEAVLNEVPDDIQDHKWGWYDLSGAYIQQSREGFILRMPKNIEPID